jgi:hypothetical protein
LRGACLLLGCCLAAAWLLLACCLPAACRIAQVVLPDRAALVTDVARARDDDPAVPPSWRPGLVAR